MSDEFGDFDQDDQFAADGEPAPQQVAFRLHELRMLLEELAGYGSVRWEDLTPEEQDIGYDLCVFLVPVILEDPNVDSMTYALHELREVLDDLVPPWHLLTEEEKVVAQSLMIWTLEWLVKEGAVR